MENNVIDTKSRERGKFPEILFDIFSCILAPLAIVVAIAALTVSLLTGCGARADVRVDAVVRASEFEEARIEIYANTAAVAESAAAEYCSGEMERIEEAVYTNAAAVAENAARECSSNEMARIETDVYANAAEIAHAVADEICSNRMERIDRALEDKADMTSLSNAVETLRGEIAASTPPGYESVSNTAYAASGAAQAASGAANAAADRADAAYIAATNALDRAESAATKAESAYIAATNAADRVDALGGRIDNATNAALSAACDYTDAATNALYAAIPAIPGDVISTCSPLWIDCTNRLAMLEFGLRNARPHVKIVFNKNGGTGGTDAIYWRPFGGDRYVGDVFYLDEEATIKAEENRIDTPVREGYAFTCYATASSGGIKYIDSSGFIGVGGEGYGDLWDRMYQTTTNKISTLVAQWDGLKTVTLKPNGGDGGDVAIYYSSKTGFWYADNLAQTNLWYCLETLPARGGYAFAGYWSSASGGTLYIDESGSIDKTPSSSTTLYAHWNEAQGGS